jgi:DNA invertase Pin-like site-specific DNA recombinase
MLRFLRRVVTTRRGGAIGGLSMDAVSYSRCSSVGQADGDSFDRQGATQDRFATLHHYNLVACFFEAITGTSDDRPAFNAMLDWCVDNGVTHILIERMDRLARKFSVGETLIAMCRKLGLTIIDCSTGENLTDDDPSPDAWLNAAFRLMVAEWEKRNLVYRTGQARARIRQSGRKCDGRKGYRDLPQFSQALQRINDLSNAGLGPTAIANRLNAEQVPTMNGKPWKRGTVHQILGSGT